MGKLLLGHYGRPPDAESVEISLKDCHQRLGLTPSDFVSVEAPGFFKKKHGALGKYIVFLVGADETADSSIWRPGHYLLPLEAADVLNMFSKQDIARAGVGPRPTQVQAKQPPPVDVLARAERWSLQSQPLLFQCHCPELILRLDPPWAFRQHWLARLTCAKRCQPAVKTKL